MSVIHLNIGSNISPRHRHISDAVEALRAEFKSSTFLISTIVESEPWGFDSSNTFLNCGVMIKTQTDIDPVNRQLVSMPSAAQPFRSISP